MIKLGTISTILIIVAASFGLYQAKYRVHSIRTEISEVEQQIETERENLHVVAAEWAYLTRPDRLKRLANEYTQLEPLKSTQVISNFDILPLAEIEQVANMENDNVSPVSQTRTHITVSAE